MRVPRSLLVLPLLLASFAADARHPRDDRPVPLATQLDDAIRRTWHPEGPGATVLVVKDGETLFRKAYGMANLEHGIELEPGMVLRLGSITKQFTAALVMQDVEAGRLSLEDDITKHLPGWPTHGHRITVEQLLNHSSGIKSYTGIPGYFMNPIRRDLTTDELLAVFRDLPPDFPPGEAFRYNNSAYVMLGAILERVNGTTYAELVRERFAETLGLRSLRFGSHIDLIPGRASGYQGTNPDWKNADFLSMSQPHAAGSLLSNVDDLYRWTKALHEGRVVSADSLKQMTSPTRTGEGETPYGFGLGLSEVRGRTAIGHGGGINGFSTFAHWLPKEKLFVAVLSNDPDNPIGPGYLAEKITGIVLGDPHPTFQAIRVDARDLKTYVGNYRLSNGETRTVSVENGKLYTRRGTGPKLEAKPHARHRFFYPGRFTHFEFTTTPSGTVTGMLMYREGAEPESAERERGPAATN